MLKVAVVHDWLVTFAGAEKVLEQILKCYPGADVYTIVDFLPSNQRSFLGQSIVKTSFIQKLPHAKQKYRAYLPLMPWAIKRFDLSAYDLILSSSHAVAKGVRTHHNQCHISYVHTPMRYAWDMRDEYLQQSGLDKGVKSWVAKYLLRQIRNWDARCADRVNYYLANSRFVAQRIANYYHRDAQVIYPPVDTRSLTCGETKADFYLTASRFVPYKRLDLIVNAFNNMPEKKLIVIGDGPEFAKIKQLAMPNVTLLGYQPFSVLRDHLQRARAFVFAALEDFGILPVEAQACGTPVIAYREGGTFETVNGLATTAPTGVLFDAQTVDSIKAAVERFEENSQKISAENCRNNALKFCEDRFCQEFMRYVTARIT